MIRTTVAFLLTLPAALYANQEAEKCEFYLNPKQPVIEQLLQEHQSRPPQIITAKKLNFFGLESISAFTAPVGAPALVEVNQFEPLVPVIEKHQPLVPIGTVLGFYQPSLESADRLSPASTIPKQGLKDPFLSRVGNELIFGGTEYKEFHGAIVPQTYIYKAPLTNLRKMEFVAETGIGTGNLRLKQLPDGRIHVVQQFSGRNEVAGGLGRNAVLTVSNLEELEPLKLLHARINYHQVGPGEGIRTTHIEPLGEDIVYVGSVFRPDPTDTNKMESYVAIYSRLDPKPKILLEQKDLAPFFKRWPTTVLQSDNHLSVEGVERHENGTATLYITLGRAEAWRVVIPDPFLAY